MSIPISHRMDAISPSLTLALDDRVRQLQAEGADLINLTVGQPDFNTPAWINAAAVAAIADGFTRYTSPIGTVELRQAAAAWFNRRGSDYGTAEILVSCGSKHALFNAFQAILQPGDEVIVPLPSWVSYPDMVRLADGVPVMPTAPFEDGYKLTPALLELSITPRTKAIIFNSPNNPTGAVYSRKEAEALAEVLLRHRITTISDEIYDEIVYDDVRSVCMATLSDEMRRNTITINGVSKAYAMTGWRIGFAAGPADVIEAMGRYQAQATSNPCSISQKAALAAITGTGPELAEMRTAFARRRRLIMDALAGTPLVRWQAPGGAFYFLIEVAKTYGRKLDGRTIRHGEDLSDLLIDRGVAMVPGSGFGAPECIRLSFAASDENLRRGMAIFNAAMEEIARG